MPSDMQQARENKKDRYYRDYYAKYVERYLGVHILGVQGHHELQVLQGLREIQWLMQL